MPNIGRVRPIRGVYAVQIGSDIWVVHAFLGRFTLNRLVSIINRPGSRVELKVKVRSMQPTESLTA